MTNESNLVFQVWELVRDQLPAARRYDVAVGMFRSFAEYGFEKRELQDILDEDPSLTRAFNDAFDDEDEDDEDYDYESIDDDEE